MKKRRYNQIHILPFLIGILVVFCAVALVLMGMEKNGEPETGLEEARVEESRLKEQASNLEEESAQLSRTESTQSTRTISSEEVVITMSVEEQALAVLKEMSLDEKVGQMFIARCPEEEAEQMAADYHLGGYILFARDFEGRTSEEVISDIQSYQSSSSIPMLIGVDEEGGTVTRVSRFPAFRETPFPSPGQLYQSGGFEAVERDTAEKSRLLKSLGINVNFAPVCDVSENMEDFIYNRSFGRNGEETSQYVETVVKTMKEQGMASVLKHFPGYGNNMDTHTGIAYDNRPYETFQTSDFLPFKAGIGSGADMVLVSHNIVQCMDARFPASLSSDIHEILRRELGFTGVIVTDDLVMEGVRDFADDAAVAVLAVQAGNDLLCCTDFKTQILAVREAVRNGEIKEQQIDESVLRILKLKISLGLMDH